MKTWTKIQKDLMTRNAITGKPSIEFLAKLWNRCELDIYDRVLDIKEELLDMVADGKMSIKVDTRKELITRYKPRTKNMNKIYDLQCNEITAIDIQEEVKIVRPSATYSNKDVVKELLGE